MSGHSKWANIKHRKGRQDARRAKLFTRCIKDLTIASKESGPNPEDNPRLRLALQNAKGANIPKDTIERAIQKGQGSDADNYQEVTYEGYAPYGVPVFVETTTDNINRTVSNVRSIFTKYGGELGKNGSLSYLFDRKGVFTVDANGLDEDDFTLGAIDGGAEDVVKEGDLFLVYTDFQDFGNMQKKLEEMNIEPKSAEVQRIPNDSQTLDLSSAKSVLSMIDKLEEDEDVQQVFHNLELTDELMAELENA